MTNPDVKFELWFEEGDVPVTGKCKIKGDRVLTEGEWGLVVECVQRLIWLHEKYGEARK